MDTVVHVPVPKELADAPLHEGFLVIWRLVLVMVMNWPPWRSLEGHEDVLGGGLMYTALNPLIY